MSIQKKSLISTLKTTKKANVASSPNLPSSSMTSSRQNARQSARKAARQSARKAARFNFKKK